MSNETNTIISILKERILVMDGAMGTMIQAQDPKAADFGGEAYEGCNEMLNLTRPDIIQSVHETYYAAGADIVETNTFGATALVLAEYGLEDRVIEINKAAAQVARAAADKFSSPNQPRFVAGSMGPTTKAITVTGGVTFDELVDNFQLQAEGLIAGGVDLLLLETAQDTLNIKAGAVGLLKALEKSGASIPIMVSATIEPTGTMLAGQGVEALYTSLEHLPLLSIGLNCATGPEFMTDHIRSLSAMAACLVSVYPNAGLPNEDGLYEESPQMLADKLERFVDEGWINIIGGCCGTTPEHIAAIAQMVKGKLPRIARPTKCTTVSGIDFLQIEDEMRPIIVGERTNVIGSRKFKRLIIEGKIEEGAEIGRAQMKKGAQVIDVCMANPDREEAEDIDVFLEVLNKKVKAPIMIDSTDAHVTELAMKRCQGKSIVNSINLEEGEQRFEEVVPLLKRYGGAVVVGCIDEDPEMGMGISRQRKMEIAKRSYDLLVGKYGIAPEDIIFDLLVFPVGTGDENYIGSAEETIEGLRLLKAAYPKVKTILGISNVSFGLPTAGREVLNAVFLYHTVKAGLDYAIVNAEKLERYPSIPEEERRLSEDLLFWRGEDPIAAFAAHFKDLKEKPLKEGVRLPLDERLANYILEGSKQGLKEDLDLKLKEMAPIKVINGPLMAGMAEVGRLFNQNELIVAEVLQSAEAMKAAVSYLETYMDKDDSRSRGKMVLATVKGDVHDIGKNLVEIILSNNGFEIVNLGIKIPPEVLIKAVKEEQPDMIGLSGLLVKSAHQMVTTAKDLKQAGIDIPMLVGGAALSKRFTHTKIGTAYAGSVLYAKDAMEGLDLANRLSDEEKRPELLESIAAESARLIAMSASKGTKKAVETTVDSRRSSVADDLPLPLPPDLDLHSIRSGSLEAIFRFISPAMLYGKHLGLQGNIDKLLAAGDEKASKLFHRVEAMKAEIISEYLLEARAVYRFLPCNARGNDLLIFDPKQRDDTLETFHFQRQSAHSRLCLSDYCRDTASEETDHIALFVVTLGKGVRELSERWKNEGEYLRSHLIQAIAIEAAEGFAEWLHKKIRADWGFADPEEMTVREVLKNKYRGMRVSFGYPACPEMSDQEKLFRLLDVTAQTGVTLTEGHMMDPEASVSALVFHHPEAKYFRVEEE